MSLEKQAEALLKATTDLIINVNAIIGVEKQVTKTSVQGTTASMPKATKKEKAELKKTAKIAAGKVLKELGMEKLKELLSRFGAKKLPDLLDEVDVYNDFVIKAEEMIEKASEKHEPVMEEDDLLGNGDNEDTAEKEYTIEDIKSLLVQVNNTKSLGRDVTKQILGDLGVTRLPQLPVEKFAQAVSLIEDALKKAGVE